MKFPYEDPFEEMMHPAQLFIFGFLFLVCIQIFLEAWPASKAWLKRSNPAVKAFGPVPRYPERIRIRIHFELAQASQRAEAEFKASSAKHSGQTGILMLKQLKEQYALNVGKKYHLSRQELEAIRQEGLSKDWLSLWPNRLLQQLRPDFKVSS